MLECNYGSLSGRQLCLRWFTPYSFQYWDGSCWRFAWRSLLSWRAWRSGLREYEPFAFRMHRHAHSTHRCYCQTGWLFDGNVRFAGFCFQWFYSHYTGPVPCPCDEAFDEMFGEEECGSRPATT